MTVAELIRGALRKLGVLASSETPTAAEESDALATLNAMLDSWAGERLALFATLRSTYTLTIGLNPHTIGTGGTFSTTRPVRIDRASIVPQQEPGAELPLALLSDAEWQETQAKEQDGRPTSLWIESAYPLMKLHFNPVPDVADTLILYTWQQLGRFASASADFDFPPGYERAILFNLAVELAPEYGAVPSNDLLRIADESKSTLKRLNYRPSPMRCDSAVLGRAGSGRASAGFAGGGGTDSGGLY